MKDSIILRSICAYVLIATAPAFAFTHLSDGIVLELRKEKPEDASLMKIQVCSDGIFRITATRQACFSDRPSLMAEKTSWKSVNWFLSEEGENLIIKTSRLSVRVHQVTGAVSFYDASGACLLQEKAPGGKIITPAEVGDERTWHIQQLFDSPADEAFYGLGQHQNGVMNYKGHDVDLWQYNIAVAVPFLVSSKNYGILWDNNSRTKFGDIRDFSSLSNLSLIDKEGKPGGLTAEYFRDAEFDSLFISRQESRIEHEFDDLNDAFPEGFRRNVKTVRWSGEIQAAESGVHKFRLYCSGYTRMWLNGELVADSWRQNWLPWTYLPELRMEVGKRYPIRIEWIHTGGYIGLKMLSPEDPVYDSSLSIWSEVADEISYYFIGGKNIDDVIGGYRTITGKAPMMPKWAMGFWQCRERYQSQEQLLNVVREFRSRQIPIDNIVQDWFYWPEAEWGSHDFDALRFPDPAGMVDTLHLALNTHIMISVWPKFYTGTQNYDAMNQEGFLYRRNVDVGQRDWVGRGYVSTFYDPYSQAARDLFWKQIREKLFDIGFDAWWLDATEPDIQSNLSREETLLRIGPTALGPVSRYLNTYSLMNAKGIYEGQRQSDPDQRVFILTRSAFAGQQRYSAATWSGDIATRWYDLKVQIPAGLNFCLSGIPYWTTDIGGFAVEPRFERNVSPEDLDEWRELNTRWIQYGVFCPLFRVHGQFPFREMFNIAPDDHPAYQTMMAYDRLRYRLMPYIYSLTGSVTHQDGTIMRALVMDFNQDPKVLNISDQFLFGPALLVNPVYDYKVRSRQVYLPSGCGWFDFKTGKYFKGGQTIRAPAPYSDIPLFVKEGSIIPIGPEIQYVDEKPVDPIRLMIYTGEDVNFTLYEDEGVNFNYENGSFSTIPLYYQEKTGLLTIGQRQGVFHGMLQERTFEIVKIASGQPKPLDLSAVPNWIVKYDGKEITVGLRTE
jgi:alpha-D-xyloside xylohydrolase